MLEELQNIDTSAIEDLCTIKAEQETLNERLQRMEERRDSVSEPVYRRVRGDYETRHGELESQARPLKQRARAEYGKLMALITAMNEALDSARLAKEELEFRHELGEFPDDDFGARRDEAVAEVERCEHELDEAEKLRVRFVGAFHNEGELTADEPEPGDEEPDDDTPMTAAEKTSSDDDAVAEGLSMDGEATADEPFDSEQEATEGNPAPWDDDSMATGMLPPAAVADLELDGEATAPPEIVGVAADEPPPPPPPPVFGDTPIPPEMMDDLPTGRMEAISPDQLPPPPPTPEPPPPGPENAGDGGEATAMFSLARLVAPGSSGAEEEHALNPTETTIGRAPGNHIQINDGAISRQHAKIVGSLEGTYTIYDLGSENGVYVNRERVIDRRLNDGDIVEIGPGTRTFIYRGP